VAGKELKSLSSKASPSPLPPSVKGMVDLLPEEAHRHRELVELVRAILERAGFQEIRTPILEPKELFLHSLGISSDIVHKEMYALKDLSGRDLVLRPEGTAPLVRAILEHHLYEPGEELRFFYHGPMFRYEQPQRGRLRQFHQIGAEVIGVEQAEIDLELLLLAEEIVEALEIPHSKLLWNTLGCPRCRPSYRQALLDSLKQVEASLCDHCQRRLKENPLRVLDCKNPRCREIVRRSAPVVDPYLCAECSTHKGIFEAGLGGLDIPAQRDPYLVRGLDYYTRTVFEFQSPELEGQNTFLAGGRYDELFSLFGERWIPAIGFALGIERSLLISRRKFDPPPHPLLLWIPFGSSDNREVLGFLKELRKAGFCARAIFHKKSLKSALRYADKLKARYVILDGEDERQTHHVRIRDMKDHTEDLVIRNSHAIIVYLRTRLL